MRRLRDLLRSDILHGSGGFDHLPGETELMVEYRATRSTVREALGLLRAEGWIDRLQGVGTVVAAKPAKAQLIEITLPLVPAAPSRPFGSVAPTVLDASVIAIPGAVGRRLDVGSGDCFRLEYLLHIQGEAAGLVTNYVISPEAEALQAIPFETNWYDYLDQAGIVVGDVAFLFSAASADASVAEQIGVSVGSPVSLIYQVICDAAMRPFNFAVMYFRPDRLVMASHGPLGRQGPPPGN